MKSRMSCCNGAILKRTLFRGLPLWGAYLLCWLVALPVFLLSQFNDESVLFLDIERYVMDSGVNSCVVMNLIYGLAVACVVSSYLYKSRSANFFAALPLRRENMFLTQYIGGFLMSLLPNLIISLATVFAGVLLGGNLLKGVAVWLGMQTLSFVFYYSFAMFVAMIVGNLVALPIIYGVLNFTAVVVETIIRALLELFVHGAWLSNDYLFLWASPAWYCLSEGQVRVRTDWVNDTWVSSTATGWDIVGIYAVVGVAFALLAFWLHQRRRMEAAGDVIAVKQLKPVFLYGFTIGCSLCIGTVLCGVLGVDFEFVPVLICMLVGAFIGYFVGQMLLHRSVRVFRSRYFANYGVTAIIIIAVMLCVRFDLFGYSSYLPQTDEVESVRIGYQRDGAFVSDRDIIEKTVQAHAVFIHTDEQYGEWGSREAYLTYRLKNGREVRRKYTLPVPSAEQVQPTDAICLYEDLYNEPAFVLPRYLPVQYTAKDILVCNIYDYNDNRVSLGNEEAYRFLKDCVEPDLKTTSLGRDYTNRNINWASTDICIELCFDRNEPGPAGEREFSGEYYYITITEDALRTLQFATDHGVSGNTGKGEKQ